jgi:Fic family protein
MSIFMPSRLTAEDEIVLGMIEKQKQLLKYHIASTPRRWNGLLRRNSMARAIQGSNSIEGYHATMDDVVAAIEDEEPMDANTETWREILGNRNALTYVLQLAEDDHFEFHAQLLRSLHFMMLQHNLKKMPGRWRPGYIQVVNDATGEQVYEGPDALLIPDLINELIAYLNGADNCHVIIKAAMAHLNLTMIHPFKDGNGRMARALQTLVLSRDGFISPVFSSIEEWLGRNTPAYYDVLALVGQGAWHPENDSHPWIQFCLKAHFQQAHTLIKRNDWMTKVYEEVSRLAASKGLADRTEVTLVDAAFNMRIRAGRYRDENEISDVVASRDLRKLCDLELLIPHGEKRGRYYTGSKELTDIAAKHRIGGKAQDPYALARSQLEAQNSPKLPGLI